MTVICYKTKTPVVYNKGTKYEKRCDEFLSYYTYKTRENAEIECNELNTTKPRQLWNGKEIDWSVIDYFFVDEQEPMEG